MPSIDVGNHHPPQLQKRTTSTPHVIIVNPYTESYFSALEVERSVLPLPVTFCLLDPLTSDILEQVFILSAEVTYPSAVCSVGFRSR